MTAPTVNAYYDPQLNEIVFPAGILQLPVIQSGNAEGAFNYGATGATIGHENQSMASMMRASPIPTATAIYVIGGTAEDHAKFKAKTDKLVAEI